MRIPWVPVTSSDGVKAPTNDVLYDKTYRTASNSVSHKAFQNLPMNTAAPAVRFEEPNPKGRYGSTKIREHGEGAGENYVDSFVTHPIPGNYASIVATLELQREEIRNAVYEPLTVMSLTELGYRDLKENAELERQGEITMRLRFGGATEDEIKAYFVEQHKERVKEMAKRALTQEEKHILQAEEAARAAIGRGAIAADRANPMGARPPADVNVYGFPNPGPPGYVAFNTTATPGNNIMAGVARSSVNRAGKGYSSESDSGYASDVATILGGRKAGRPRGAKDKATRQPSGLNILRATGREVAEEEAAVGAGAGTTTSKTPSKKK